MLARSPVTLSVKRREGDLALTNDLADEGAVRTDVRSLYVRACWRETAMQKRGVIVKKNSTLSYGGNTVFLHLAAVVNICFALSFPFPFFLHCLLITHKTTQKMADVHQ